MERVWAKDFDCAHNGSSPALVEELLPYLDYAAIDVKGATDESLARRAGLKPGRGRVGRTLSVIKTLTAAGVLVDARTCVFGDTSREELLAIRSRLLDVARNNGDVFWTLRKYNEIASCDFVPGDATLIKAYAEQLATPELKVGFRDKWTGATFSIF